MQAYSVKRSASLSLMLSGVGIRKAVLEKGIEYNPTKVHGKLSSICELTGHKMDVSDAYPPLAKGPLLLDFEVSRRGDLVAICGEDLPEEKRAVTAQAAVLIPKGLYVYFTGTTLEHGKLSTRVLSSGSPLGGYNDVILFLQEGQRAILMPERIYREGSRRWQYGVDTTWANIWEVFVQDGVPVLKSQAELSKEKQQLLQTKHLDALEASEWNEIE